MSILVLTSDTLIGTAAAGNIEYNGQFFGTDSNASRAQLQRIVRATAQASTSGVAIDFTAIPAWAQKITVMFSGVSTNSTSPKIIQLGDSGGVETSGYIGTGTVVGNGGATSTGMSSGFFASQASAATDVLSGQATISLLDSATNTWAYSGVFGQSTATAIIYWSGGAKPLSATLDRVRITTVTGTDTFDAGTVNIIYEG